MRKPHARAGNRWGGVQSILVGSATTAQARSPLNPSTAFSQNQPSLPDNQVKDMETNHVTGGKVVDGRINGRFAPGFSGNAGGSPDAVRRVVNKAFLQDMAIAWQKHGAKALDRVAKEHPVAFCKMYTLIIPRQLTLEHSNAIKNLSDEALEAMIQHLEASMEAKAQGGKVIEGTTFAGLPAPEAQSIGAGLEPKRQRRPNRMAMQADTAVGPRERTSRRVPPPSRA
jgi:hypothetical protein